MPGHSMLWAGTNRTYMECTRLQICRPRHPSESKLICLREAITVSYAYFFNSPLPKVLLLQYSHASILYPAISTPPHRACPSQVEASRCSLRASQGSSSLVLRVGCLLGRHLLVLRLPLGRPLSLGGALLVLLGRSAASWRLLILLRRRASSWRLLVLRRRGPSGWRLLELLRRRAALRHLVLRLLPCTWEL